MILSMRFRWLGPENWFVGDAGGEGIRMSNLADGYDCEEFGGKIKNWIERGWIEVIEE
jgi:predicted enzyme involved in methoxymalonyl-ACP biosynthesis